MLAFADAYMQGSPVIGAFPVTLYGAAVRDFVRGMDAAGVGRVVAVFSRSFYLANARDELACIGPAGLGGGPLNMLCALPAAVDWQASGLRTGDAVSWDGAHLLAVGRGPFDLASAVAWRPAPPPASWDVATLAAGLGPPFKLPAAPGANHRFAAPL